MKLPQISETIRQHVREVARERCGYCLSPQRFVMGVLEIEHLVPRAKGGSSEEDNLWLSCSLCNRYKGAQISAVDTVTGGTAQLFNPRHDIWAEHFAGAKTASESKASRLLAELQSKLSS